MFQEQQEAKVVRVQELKESSQIREVPRLARRRGDRYTVKQVIVRTVASSLTIKSHWII